MDPELAGLIGMLLMFVFMFMGMPIGFCMAITGLLGQIAILGVHGAILQLGTVPYATIASFTLCVIPLFMLMGELAYSSGITEQAYSFAYKIFGRIRGGLAMSTIVASCIFAACTGSSVASAATFTKVSLPEMRRYKYHPGLATGAIAAGGSLGVLIPPSNPMILYSIFSGASIGKLFMAGIIPGLLLTTLFMIAIYIRTTINPSVGPAGEKSTLREIATQAKELLAPFILVFGVLGGLWFGVFSPSEAGAAGAFIAMLLLFQKQGKSGFKKLSHSLRSTANTSGMIFLIVIGALIFGDFMTLSNLPGFIVKFIERFSLSPLMVIFLLMLIYIVLGALMDELAIILITIPIILPSLEHLGVDLIWFGILFSINQQMGLILPPVGMLVFVLAGMIPDIPMYTIYKGIMPFALAMFVCILLIMFFPQIALWVPNMMMH